MAMPDGEKVVQIRIPHDVYTSVKAKADQEQKSVSELLRPAIYSAANRKSDKRKKPDSEKDAQPPPPVQRKISKLHDAEVLWRLLNEETDRGCVIVGVTMLDDVLAGALGSLMKSRCTSGDDDEFFQEFKYVVNIESGSGPLGSMAARIRACFLLGLIDSRRKRMLNHLLRLRNTAAHLAEDFGFDDSEMLPVWEQIDQREGLAMAVVAGTLKRRRKGEPENIVEFDIHPRKLFIAVAMWLYVTILEVSGSPNRAKSRLKDTSYIDEILRPLDEPQDYLRSGSSKSKKRAAKR